MGLVRFLWYTFLSLILLTAIMVTLVGSLYVLKVTLEIFFEGGKDGRIR